MSGLTSSEWLRAQIIADIFHWGMVGVLALLGILANSWGTASAPSSSRICVDGLTHALGAAACLPYTKLSLWARSSPTVLGWHT